jgi:hypothetical protein
MHSNLNSRMGPFLLCLGVLLAFSSGCALADDHQREMYVDVGRHLSDLKVGMTDIVPAKNDDNGSPIQSNVIPQLPNAVPQLPNAVPQLPNAVPQLPNAVPQLPNAVPQLPNAVPQLPNATPPASGSNPRMPAFQQPLGVP